MKVQPWVRLLAVTGLTLACSSNAWALIKAGKVAPSWSAKTLAGKPIASSQFKGRVILLNFFSYGCGPCHEEYPHLEVLHKKYGAKGFSVVSVTFDQDPKEAGAFAKEIKATFPVIQDANTAIFEKFAIEPIPANVVIDRNGKVVASFEGAPNLKALEAAIQKAIGS
jgi:peroxiredoxin